MLRARPGGALAALALAVAVVAVLEAAYPRYWERSRAAAGAAAGPSGRPATGAPRPPAPGTRPARPPAPGGVITVLEFSDYECPYCAKAHEANKALFAGREDVVLVRKQYPLDPTCNPAMKRALHLSACQLARAAICARAQGRFDEMDDALFANQRAKEPVQEVARKVGLDLAAFGTCLDAPETVRALEAEVAEGTRAGVNATPTYVVNGTDLLGRAPSRRDPAPPRELRGVAPGMLRDLGRMRRAAKPGRPASAASRAEGEAPGWRVSALPLVILSPASTPATPPRRACGSAPAARRWRRRRPSPA